MITLWDHWLAGSPDWPRHPHVSLESNRADVARWFEGWLARRYPGTRWVVRPVEAPERSRRGAAGPGGSAGRLRRVDLRVVATGVGDEVADEVKEGRLDERVELLFGDEGWGGAVAALLVSQAAVAALVVAHHRRHRIATALAAHQPGQQGG